MAYAMSDEMEGSRMASNKKLGVEFVLENAFKFRSVFIYPKP
jgi:hypothetical protein